jgi:tRNA-methyltransferase O
MGCVTGVAVACLFLMIGPAVAQEKPKMAEEIIMRPIGVVHSQYTEAKGTPVQGVFDDKKAEAWVQLKDKYTTGLKDLDGFSHAILLYHFHLSDRKSSENPTSKGKNMAFSPCGVRTAPITLGCPSSGSRKSSGTGCTSRKSMCWTGRPCWTSNPTSSSLTPAKTR